jgi:methylmalonyl-CoA mutase N-terminal domain/subunit
MENAIEKGYVQSEIADSAYRYQKDIENKKKIVVGVNDFIIDEKATLDTLKVDPAVEEKQRKGLAALRKERDNEKVGTLLTTIKEKAKSDVNLMPHVLEAVKEYATLGEICDVLREVFGEYKANQLI